MSTGPAPWLTVTLDQAISENWSRWICMNEENLPFNWIVPTNPSYYSVSSPKLSIETKNFEMNYWDILSFEFKL